MRMDGPGEAPLSGSHQRTGHSQLRCFSTKGYPKSQITNPGPGQKGIAAEN